MNALNLIILTAMIVTSQSSPLVLKVPVGQIPASATIISGPSATIRSDGYGTIIEANPSVVAPVAAPLAAQIAAPVAAPFVAPAGSFATPFAAAPASFNFGFNGAAVAPANVGLGFGAF